MAKEIILMTAWMKSQWKTNVVLCAVHLDRVCSLWSRAFWSWLSETVPMWTWSPMWAHNWGLSVPTRLERAPLWEKSVHLSFTALCNTIHGDTYFLRIYVALCWIYCCALLASTGSILFSQHAYLAFMGKDVLNDVSVPMEHLVIMWQGSVAALLVSLEWAVSKVRTYNLLIGQISITETPELPKLVWIWIY